MGGVDRRDQRKRHTFYDDLVAARADGAALSSEQMETDGDSKRDGRDRREGKRSGAGDDRASGNGNGGGAARKWFEKKLEDMDARDWRACKEQFQITIRGSKTPNPLRAWNEAGFPPELLESITRVGLKEPTPIQRAVIPCSAKHLDVAAFSQAGSGTTLAFLFSILSAVSKLPRLTAATAQDGMCMCMSLACLPVWYLLVPSCCLECCLCSGPYAVVLVPARELALATAAECEKFGALKLRSVVLVGGSTMEEQGIALRTGPEIVVATPGRLLDCLQQRLMSLARCQFVVLDEADRMVMTSGDHLTAALDLLPAANAKPENSDAMDDRKAYRQILLFSSSLSTETESLARKYLRHPAFITIGDRSSAASNIRIEHRVLWLTAADDKSNRLRAAMADATPPVLVFTNEPTTCDQVWKALNESGYSASALHSGKSDEQRTSHLDAFKSGRSKVLVLTDAATRLLAVPNVSQVINYDLPRGQTQGEAITKFIARNARTGTAEHAGLATSFCTADDTDILFDLRGTRHESARKTLSFVLDGN